MPRVKAVIWNYFIVSERNERFAMCLLCQENVSQGGKTIKTFGTSTLIDHLKKKHPVDFKDYEEKKKVQELTVKQSKEHRKKQLTLEDTNIQQWDINNTHAVLPLGEHYMPYYSKYISIVLLFYYSLILQHRKVSCGYIGRLVSKI